MQGPEEPIIADTRTRSFLSRLQGGVRRALWFAAVSAQEPIYGLTFVISLIAFIAAAVGLVVRFDVSPDAVAVLPTWLHGAIEAAPLAFLLTALGVIVAAQAFSRAFDILVDWLDPR